MTEKQLLHVALSLKGEVILPAGEVILPTGEVILPAGEVILPAGDVTFSHEKAAVASDRGKVELYDGKNCVFISIMGVCFISRLQR
jgi:hypothetical protein